MMADPEKIRTELSKLIRDRLPEGVSGVTVEPSETDDGEEFLLVTVALAGADFDDEALERLLEEIEERVAHLDERYPSVRFQDAA